MTLLFTPFINCTRIFNTLKEISIQKCYAIKLRASALFDIDIITWVHLNKIIMQ